MICEGRTKLNRGMGAHVATKHGGVAGLSPPAEYNRELGHNVMGTADA